MAAVFDQVDLVISATNPDVAYPADDHPQHQGRRAEVGPRTTAPLTIPANIVGSPPVSIPVGPVDGLPVGMQIIGRHHADALLLDLARHRRAAVPLAAGGPRRTGLSRPLSHPLGRLFSMDAQLRLMAEIHPRRRGSRFVAHRPHHQGGGPFGHRPRS